MRQKLSALFAALAIMVMPAVASAHVVVKPAEVLTGAFQTFTMGVPNEKDGAIVTKLRLVIPGGLDEVSPSVKAGWTISTEKSGSGDDAKISAITWDAGTIPAGLRDDFTFSAKVPDNPTSLDWKAYQTYDDGTTVAWDQTPTPNEADNDAAPTGPYSVTAVVKAAPTTGASTDKSGTDNTARYLSIAALVVAVIAFAISSRPKKN